MPLFQKRKPVLLTLGGLGLFKSEIAESDAFLEAHGITSYVATHDPSWTPQRFRQYLEECVNQNRFNKVWVYHLLGNFYLAEGRLEEAVSVYSRAILEYPDDPRAYYNLGTIYYGISYHATETDFTHRPDFSEAPIEMQELAHQVHEDDKKHPQLTQALRESKLAASPLEAAKLALKYYRKTVACNIANEDERLVQTHIILIKMRWNL